MIAGARTGLAPIVEPVARAVKNDRLTDLAGILAGLDRNETLGKELFLPPNPGHYARRLIWCDEGKGSNPFVIVAMTWAPGQGAPLHDHCGLWGAEIVLDGLMHETTYRLRESNGQSQYRFSIERESFAPQHSVGALAPPLEYHAFRNAGSTVARTLHVYGGQLESCRAFFETGDLWWRAERIVLRYDGVA